MKKLTGFSLFVFFCVVSAILTAGLVFYQNNNNALNANTSNVGIAKLASTGVSMLDMTEISKHNKSSDCWFLIDGKVYNITSYFGKHPGGSGTMSATCGKDATSAYKTKDPYSASAGSSTAHSGRAQSLLSNYYIGDLNQRITKSSNTTTSNLNSNSNNTVGKTINRSTTPSSGTTVLTSQEVAKHNTNFDCWIIVNSNVYNISNYASSHPGGTRNITNYCGKESTQAYETKGGAGRQHSSSASSMLDQYFVGNLNQSINQTTLDQKIQANPTSANTYRNREDD